MSIFLQNKPLILWLKAEMAWCLVYEWWTYKDHLGREGPGLGLC